MLLHNNESSGMEAASNKGIRASRSDYVVLHDDDDSWEPSFLLETSAFLEQKPSYVGVATRTLRVEERLLENEVVPLRSSHHQPILSNISLVEMAARNQFPPISFVFRRSLFEKVGGFDEAMDVFGDWDFNLRALLEGEIGVIPKVLANYHVRISSSKSPPSYENSLVPKGERQDRSRTEYVNRMLRKDIKSGKVGLGFLLMAQTKPFNRATATSESLLSRVLKLAKNLLRGY